MIRINACIDDSPLPEPEFIDHIAQQSNLSVVILRRLILLKRVVSPLNDIIHHSSRFHLNIVLISVVDDGLLEGCCVGSSLAELLY